VAVDARTILADMMETLGTFNVEALQLGAAVVGAKPRLAAHWPNSCPLAQSGPKPCVGEALLPWHCKTPPTLVKLTSDGVIELLFEIRTLPWTSPRSAWHAPELF
jgi:hypothetical protein